MKIHAHSITHIKYTKTHTHSHTITHKYRIQYTQEIYVCLTVKLRGVAEKGGTNESTRDNFARNRIKHKSF